MNSAKMRLPLAALLALAPVAAQPQPHGAGVPPRHELSVYGEGGLSTLRYALPPQVERDNGFGGGGGLGYAFFFSDNVGLRTGVGVSLLRAAAHLNASFVATAAAVDEYYAPCEFRTTFGDGYRERQSAVVLHVPLTLHYQGKPFLTGVRPYARAGFRLDAPLSGGYRANATSLTNELYYPDLDIALRAPAYKGLGKFSGKSSSGDLSLALSVAAVAEAGVKWQLPRAASLYTGLYVGYGLSNALKQTDGGDLVVRGDGAPSELSVGSVLASRYEAGAPFTEKALLLSAGLKVEVTVDAGIPTRRFTEEAGVETEGAMATYYRRIGSAIHYMIKKIYSLLSITYKQPSANLRHYPPLLNTGEKNRRQSRRVEVTIAEMMPPCTLPLPTDDH